MFLRQQARLFSSTARKLDFSKMTMVGRIGSDITEHTSAKNVKFLKYSIASRKNANTTNWYNITAFDENQIKFMQEYATKGSLVYVEADASNNIYEREDGSKGYSLNLIQRDFNLLRSPRREEPSEGTETEA